MVKNLLDNAGDLVRPLGWEDPLEKEMATHSSILAWRIPWQAIGSQRVGHETVLKATKLKRLGRGHMLKSKQLHLLIY